MGEKLYDKYIISGPQPGDNLGSGQKIAWVNDDVFKGSHQYHVHWVYEFPRNVPGMKTWEDMGHGPHEHKTPEVLIHIGTDPDNPMELGGEVWINMGPEMETHVLTKSCLVYLPAGFVHSPWVIKKVNRPFVIVTVMQETIHTEKSHPELIPKELSDKMLYIDQGYDSDERVIRVPKGIEKDWH